MLDSGISYRSDIKITNELLWSGLKQAAKSYASGRLVDIGCGTKPYEQHFLPYVTQYFGVDWEPAAGVHYGSDTRADLFADCTDTKLEAESFDTLISTQVMEHIYDTHAYLRECNRLLKKGGVGIYTVPFVWQTHAEPYDYYRFTPYSLEKLFEQHGFAIEKIEPLGGAYAAVIQTKIISIYCRPSGFLPYRIFRTIRNAFMIPLLNYMALRLDRLFWNGKLCLNYLVVVRKPD
jgi:SAM-dependent methyltransferase